MAYEEVEVGKYMLRHLGNGKEFQEWEKISASKIAPSSKPYGLYFLGQPLFFFISIIATVGATSKAVVCGDRTLA
ncbi:uncharacterized protein G2W53_014042 [Senna tora]|uniref:Uncharacterized protein n=1 Tax=Senna tora TaxID=362788 RepID=A0A834WSV9_9FABA|nr:uncharacterized protein G2W53_014042 [Senna tora]